MTKKNEEKDEDVFIGTNLEKDKLFSLLSSKKKRSILSKKGIAVMNPPFFDYLFFNSFSNRSLTIFAISS